jgi:hypothetical protein
MRLTLARLFRSFSGDRSFTFVALGFWLVRGSTRISILVPWVANNIHPTAYASELFPSFHPGGSPEGPDDPLRAVTYAVFRMGTKETKLDPSFQYGS